MTKQKLKRIQKAAGKRLDLACDEYHAHSVTRGCYMAKDKKDLVICELCEYAYSLLDKMEKAGRVLRRRS